MLEALVIWWHKSFTFERTNNVQVGMAAATRQQSHAKITDMFKNQNQGMLWTWQHYKHTSFTSIRNNKTTSHRKITTYRLSPEMNTWTDTGRNSKQTTCLCRDTGGKGTLPVMMMMSWCLMSSDVSWHIRDKLWPLPKHGSIILYVHGNQKAR